MFCKTYQIIAYLDHSSALHGGRRSHNHLQERERFSSMNFQVEVIAHNEENYTVNILL